MAAPYKKTAALAPPRASEKITSDTLYWNNLEFPVTKKEYGCVSDIDFCPVQPHVYAVTSSARIQVYSSRNNQVVKTLTRFREVAYSGSFRGDGKLLVAGSDEPVVRLFDVRRKALLRVFKGHTGPVHVTKFLHDNVHILSGSDDKTVRVWDIPSESELVTFNDHQDYVRCGIASKASTDIILTGSYDHKVRVYDVRAQSSVLTVEHGHPVESLLMFPAGGVFISAGGNVMKVWDMLAGGRLLATFSNHHKTITSMCFCSNYQRLVSASLDRHVKIYDVSSYQVVHTLDYPSAILCVGMSPDDSLIAVGMSDGLLSVQRRTDPAELAQEKTRAAKSKKASYQYKLHTVSYAPSKDDHVVEHKRKEQLAAYDKHFKRFDHSKALDAAMDLRVRMKTPEVTVGVMRELIRRGGLAAALAGRNDKSLTAIFKFLQKNMSNPGLMSTLIDVANLLLDLYSEQIGQSSAVDQMVVQLKRTIDQESSYMKQMYELLGTLDTMFAASQHPQAGEPESAPDAAGFRQTDKTDAASLEPSQSALEAS